MGLKENLQAEPISRLQIRKAVIAGPTDSVRAAVSNMRKNDIGCAIVTDKDQRPIGIFTESMLSEMLAHHPTKLDEPLEKHMADRCPWVKTTDPVGELLEAMQLKNIRLLCVVDDDDSVVGLTGQRGLMEYVADHFPGQVMVQRVGMPPYLSDREGA